jgi:hypothetical protein
VPEVTIDDYIKAVSENIRGNLRTARYKCLSSLLTSLGESCIADEVGLIERVSDDFYARIRRSIPFTSPSQFMNRVGTSESLTAILNEAEKQNQPFVRTFPPCEDTALGVKAADSWDWIIVVPVWPSSNWADSADTRYWLYLWTPRLFGFVHPELKDALKFANEFPALGVEWFGWKHNRLAYRNHVIHMSLRKQSRFGGDTERASRVADAFHETIVRPVLPSQIAKVMRSLVSTIDKSDAPSRVRGISECIKHFNDIIKCAMPCDQTGNNSCNGCSQGCPQGGYIQSVRVVAEITVWETGFWKEHDQFASAETTGENSTDQQNYKQYFWDAVQSLKSCAQLLDGYSKSEESYQTEPTHSLVLDVGKLFNEHPHTRERLLIRFFLARAIHESIERFEKRWGGDASRATSCELQLLANYAELAVLLIADNEWSPEAIRNLIRVISDYGHQILGVSPVVDLGRHLRQTLRGESALYTLKKRYRDHFFHTIEVCLIGFAFLKSRPEGGDASTLSELLTSRCQAWNSSSPAKPKTDVPDYVPASESELLAQWWVAATIHDTAYGIDVLKSTLDLLTFFSNHDGISDFRKNVTSEVKVLHGKLRKVAPELELDPTLEKGDHGVIAANHLYQSLRRNDPQLAKAYLPAIRAIAFHNTKYPEVDAARDPIAALLILCDTVQDWGRSQLGYDRSATVVLSRLVSSAGTPNDEQFGPVREFAFSVSPQPERAVLPKLDESGFPRPVPGWKPAEHVWASNEGRPQFKVTLDYGSRAGDGTGIFFNWADTTFNLRRVDYRPWGLDIRVCHRLAFDPRVRSSKINELAQFVSREELGFIEPWIRTAAERDPGRPVCHQIEKENSRIRETLTFNLLALSEAFKSGDRLIYGTLGAFEEAMSRMPVPAHLVDCQEPQQRPPVVLTKFAEPDGATSSTT